MRDGSWAVMGHLLNIKPWKPAMSFQDVKLYFCSYWVQFHILPLEGFSTRNVCRLGEKVEKVEAIEEPVENGNINRSFVRGRIMIDLKKLLVKGT